MEVGVLGPLLVREHDAALPLGTPQQQQVLGLLAVRVGEPVSLDELSFELWGERPPPSAVAKVRGYAAALRRLLALATPGAHRVVRSGSGYLLEANSLAVDLIKFEYERNRARAQTPSDPATAAQHLERAIGLWRGVMLDGLPRGPVLAGLCTIVEQNRLAAVDGLAELHIGLGDPDRAGALLLQQILVEPLREQSHALLMRARYQTDGVAAALRVYESIRGALGDQLGVEPGSELQRLHRAVLNRDTTLDPRRPSPVQLREAGVGPADGSTARPPSSVAAGDPDVPSANGPVVGRSTTGGLLGDFSPPIPMTLPPGPIHFKGRGKEVALIQGLLTRAAGQDATALVVSGPGGVGKTALSLHVAHSLRADYPDGQLYVDLNSCGNGSRPRSFDVLGRFLRLLGVFGAAMPDRQDERVALYRHLLANRRVMVVLDDLADEEELRALLPGGPGCAIIATSRSLIGRSLRMPMVALHPLSDEDALQLLIPAASRERIATEADALAEVCELCGHMPLASRLASGWLAAQPDRSGSRLVSQVRDERTGFTSAQPRRDVEAMVSVAFRALTSRAQQLLCRVADLDLVEVDALMAAAALDVPVATAGETVDQLRRAHLLETAAGEESEPPRYRLHSMVRAFAVEWVNHGDSPPQRERARERAFAACLSLLEAGYRSICGRDLTVPGPAPRWEVIGPLPESLLTRPLRWYERELPNILALVQRAAADRQTALCWEIAVRAAMLSQLNCDRDAQSQLLAIALAAARKADDRRGEAAALVGLGSLCADRSELPPARQHLSTAAALFSQIGDRHGEAIATLLLGTVARFAGEDRQALIHYHAALAGLQDVSDHSGTSSAFHGIGQTHLGRRQLASAERYFAKARDHCRLSGSRQSLARITYSQGLLRLEQARYADAEARLRESLGIAQAVGYRPGQAHCLHELGRCYQRQGMLGRAREALAQALEIVRQPCPTRLEAQIRSSLLSLDTAPARHCQWD